MSNPISYCINDEDKYFLNYQSPTLNLTFKEVKDLLVKYSGGQITDLNKDSFRYIFYGNTSR